MPPRRKRPRISAAQSLLDDDALSPRKRPTLEEPPLDYPYSRTLAGHHGCVNALACSPKDGRWLARSDFLPQLEMLRGADEDSLQRRRRQKDLALGYLQ